MTVMRKNMLAIKGILTLVVFCGFADRLDAECSTCGASGAVGGAAKAVPAMTLSMGATEYGQPAGSLRFSTSLPDSLAYTPVLLTFDGGSQPGVTVCNTPLTVTRVQVSVNTFTVDVTNTVFYTNYLTATSNDSSGNTITYTNGVVIITNFQNQVDFVVQTNIVSVPVNYTVLRQVSAPQAVADIPPSSDPRGYSINFYYPGQVTGQNGDGTRQFSGAPYLSWSITNPDPVGIHQIQITQTASNTVLKQVTYIYNTNNNTWLKQSLAGVQTSETVSNLDATTYQVLDTVQYAGQPVSRQTETTYRVYPGGSVPIQREIGVGADVQSTLYTYYPDGSPFNAGPAPLLKTVTHPDGSQEDYTRYNADGRATDVLSTYGDDAHGRETITDYTVNALGGSGDDGTVNSTVARVVIEKIGPIEVSRRYTVFPSPFIQLDIQCPVPGAAWNDSRNLVTTNVYYPRGGPNQFALQCQSHPDGTLTLYDYTTTDLYRTTTTLGGRPDASRTRVVDGTRTQTVVSQSGSTVSTTAWDVQSGLMISQENYENYDRFGRAQTVTHLDRTTEQTYYACCGLDYTIDRDGVETVYNYDLDRRQTGYLKYYTGSQILKYQNVLDSLGRSVLSRRVGADDSVAAISGSAYDTAGRVSAQTNAAGGVTRFHYAPTGSPNRTTVNPDGGTRIETFYADGTPKAVTGTAVHSVRYEYGVDTDVQGNRCTFTQEIKLLADGVTDSGEWTRTYSDALGRNTEVLYADGQYSQSFYNAQGQLWKQQDPDGVTSLYVYNGKGEQAYAIAAVSAGTRKIATYADLQTQLSDLPSGNDRVTFTTNDVTADHGVTVRRSRSYVWAENGSGTPSLVSLSETSADGLNSWQTSYADADTALTNFSQTTYSGCDRSSALVAPDGSQTVSRFSYGRLLSTTRFDSQGKQLASATYAYDAHGRQALVTDARNGATLYAYNNADQVSAVTTPNPGNGQPETTSTVYDLMQRPTTVVQPDGTTVSSVYWLTGELGFQFGSRTYPVAYGFDYAGRQLAMTNWSGFDTLDGARVTTWHYDPQRGWLTGKSYPDGRGPSYHYTAAGRLQQRIWARGVITTNAYDLAGSLSTVGYSDATPGVAYTYDRLGRQSTAVWNGMTDTLTYNLASQILGDTFTGGSLAGLSLTNTYDSLARRTALSFNLQPSTFNQSFGYDQSSRLASVSDANGNGAIYRYLANSPLVGQIESRQNGILRMTTRKTYDYLNRLTQVSSQPSAPGLMPIDYNYSYNPANQRTRTLLADGSYWVYGYDSLGQATNACKYFADGTPVPGQQFHYQFDTIGNRTQTRSGGDAVGSSLRLASYSANRLNQIIQRDVPGTNDILGAALAANPVTVNGRTAARKGEYFWAGAGASNAAAPAWLGVDILSAGITNRGSLFVAQTPEILQYDADGNLASDGRWDYVWDAENRLIQMTANTCVGPQYRLTFDYDYKGRRIQKTVATKNGAAYVGQFTNIFVYDGWNLIAILNSSFSLLNSFTWGSDLSGSLQGAGGVGGLLASAQYSNFQLQSADFYAYDGNGNVAALINADDGTVSARYEYGAFGEPVRMTGSLAGANPFRFSTKYADAETDLLYYGYRYYKPATGTWVSRDLIGETGGFNMYENAGNDPVNRVDIIGLWGSDVHLVATTRWAKMSGYPDLAAGVIGIADEAVDGGFSGGGTGWAPWGDQSYHFDRNKGIGKDSRIQHFEDHFLAAKQACTKSRDEPEIAANELGTALHPYQDWVAHGAYGVYDNGNIWSTHNSLSPQKNFGDPSHYPDDVGLDAIDGLSGRPAGSAMHVVVVNSGVSVREYALYERGFKRISLTRQMSTGVLIDFKNYVKQNGDCKCRKYFGID